MLVCLLTEIDGPGIYLKTVKLNFLGLTRLCFESSVRLMTNKYSSWILFVWEPEHKMNWFQDFTGC